MAFLNIFKGKKGKFQKRSEKRGKRKTGKPAILAGKEKKPEKILTATEKVKPKETEKKAPQKTEKPRRGDIKIAPGVLRSPHVTEKATFLQEKNQYIFKVFSTATKPEIKKSIENVYGVNVEKVRVITVPRKSKRLSRSRGWQAGYKKAIITIKKGENIEVMPR